MTEGIFMYCNKTISFIDVFSKNVHKYGNSAGVYIPSKYVGRKVLVVVLKEESDDLGI